MQEHTSTAVAAVPSQTDAAKALLASQTAAVRDLVLEQVGLVKTLLTEHVMDAAAAVALETVAGGTALPPTTAKGPRTVRSPGLVPRGSVSAALAGPGSVARAMAAAPKTPPRAPNKSGVQPKVLSTATTSKCTGHIPWPKQRDTANTSSGSGSASAPSKMWTAVKTEDAITDADAGSRPTSAPSEPASVTSCKRRRVSTDPYMEY